MFSYRAGICNQVRLNVEEGSSTAESSHPAEPGHKCRFLDRLSARERACERLGMTTGWGTGGTHRPPSSSLSLFPFQVHRLYRQIPVCFEDFETLLLFVFVGFLVGE